MVRVPESIDRFTAILSGIAAASARARAREDDGDFAAAALALAAEGLPALRRRLEPTRPDAVALLDREAAKARDIWLAWPGSPRLRDASALMAGVRRFDAFATSVPVEALPDADALAAAAGDPQALAEALLDCAAVRDPEGFGPRRSAGLARSVLLDAASHGLRQFMEPMALALDLADAFAAALGHEAAPAEPAPAPQESAPRSSLEALMAALANSDRAQAAENADIAYASVVEAARPIAAAVAEPSRAAAELDRAIDLLVQAQAVASGRAGAAAAGEPHREAAALVAAGDFAAAGALAEAALTRRGPEAALSEAAVQLLDVAVTAAVLRRDAGAVARLEAERAGRASGGGALFGALRACFIGWWSRGGRGGLVFDLEVAAEVATRWAEAATSRAERGRALHNRAMALSDRAGALSDPQARAAAVEAFRDALAVRTRAEGLEAWAMTAHGLAKALTALGEQSGRPAPLREATELLREALATRTRDFAPVEWAASQLALAAALHALGDIEGGHLRYREAVAAYRAALEETCRTRAPLVWAKAQHDMGDALTALGQRAEGLARLREAVSAYEAALSALDRACTPFDWAISSGACGVARGLLASASGDASGAAEAIERIRDARDTMRAAGDAAYAAHFDGQLAAARGLHARLGG